MTETDPRTTAIIAHKCNTHPRDTLSSLKIGVPKRKKFKEVRIRGGFRIFQMKGSVNPKETIIPKK